MGGGGGGGRFLGTQGSSRRSELLGKVQDTKLRNAVDEIYRPNAKIGDGGLADAIRYELKTNELVGGKSHIQKGWDRLRNLENILNKQSLDRNDTAIIKQLIDDLRKALGGK